MKRAIHPGTPSRSSKGKKRSAGINGSAYDVIVAGGGPAGLGAAVAAARNGAETLLLESANCLGGMLTNGLVSMRRTAGDNGGIVREFWNRLVEADSARIGEGTVMVNPCVARVVALELALSAGVQVLFHTLADGVEMRDGVLTGIWIANKGGRQLVKCRTAVDATGDGDLAAWAGAPFDKGRGRSGALQGVSLNFALAGVEMEKQPSRKKFQTICAEARARGELDALPNFAMAWQGGWHWEGFPPDVMHFQYDLAYGIDASDPQGFTDGEVVCHRQVFRIWRFLRKNFEAYRNSVLINIASTLGVRETRRIRGEKTLTEADVLEARKHPDGMARCSFYMDLHDGQRKYPVKEYRARRAPPSGDFYEIPYGCLVPLKVDNLLVSGRCISSTRPANGSLRLQATCMNTGQASGTAAALCARTGRCPRQLNGAELRQVLREQGMEL